MGPQFMSSIRFKPHPLLLVGAVVLLNGETFLLMSWALQTVYLLGVAVSGAVVGLVLSTVGYVVSVKARPAKHEEPELDKDHIEA